MNNHLPSPPRTSTVSRCACLLLFLLLLSLANAQAPDQVASNGCLTIQSDWTMCSAYQGLAIDTQAGPTSILSLLFSRSSSSDSRPLSILFRDNFSAFIDSNRIRMPNGVNVTYSQNFKDRYLCPNYTHFHRRFLISMWCTDFVHSSSEKCPRPPNVPLRPLCRSTCNIFSQTTIQSFQNATQCPPLQNNPTRNNGLNEIPAFCGLDLFNGREPNCISGDTIEPETCGFLMDSQMCDMAVCNRAKNLCLRKGVPVQNESLAVSGDVNSSVQTSAVIVGVIIISVIILLAGGCVFWYWRKRNARSTATLPKTRPLEKEKPVSMFMDSQKPTSPVLSSYDNQQARDPYSNENSISNPYANLDPNQLTNAPYHSSPYSPTMKTLDNSYALGANKRASSMMRDNKTVSITDLLVSLERHTANTLRQSVMSGADGAPPVVEYDNPLQHIVIRDYEPLMDDEMELQVDDVIALSQSYDDGWAFGLNLTTGQMGVLPIGFIQPMVVDVDVSQVKSRISKYGDLEKLEQVRAMTRVSVSGARANAETMYLGSEIGSQVDVDRPTAIGTANINADRHLAESMYFGAQDDDDDDEIMFNKISNSRVTIDTVMEVLAQIAQTDRGTRMLSDLDLEPSMIDKRDPKARHSIIQGIKRERQKSINGGDGLFEGRDSRFSFGTLMDVLEDHGGDGSMDGSDYDDEQVDPATLANTLLNAYNIGMEQPPVTNSMYMQSPATDSMHLQPPPNPMYHNGYQNGFQNGSVMSEYDQQRPVSTLSDLDRLESLLSREEQVLRQMRN